MDAIASICGPLGVLEVGVARSEVMWDKNVNTSSINARSSGCIAQVTVVYERNTRNGRSDIVKKIVTEAYHFISESVVELIQFGPHGWYIGLFERHKSFL